MSWGMWAVLSKVIGGALSPAHSQALSAIGFVPVLAILAFLPGKAPGEAPRVLRGTLFAAAAGLVTSLGNLAYYAALQRGERAVTVIPLTALYPLVTILLAVPLLGERLGRAQRAGAALSLLATYLFNVPSEAGLISGALVHALPPILLWGLSGLCQKISTAHLSGERSALVFLAAALPVSLVILLREPAPVASMTPRMWALVVALGLFFALGNLGILLAFARGGKASLIAPLGGLYPLVGVPVAIAFLGERASIREGLGLAVALIAVVALALEAPTASPPEPNPRPTHT